MSSSPTPIQEQLQDQRALIDELKATIARQQARIERIEADAAARGRGTRTTRTAAARACDRDTVDRRHMLKHAGALAAAAAAGGVALALGPGGRAEAVSNYGSSAFAADGTGGYGDIAITANGDPALLATFENEGHNQPESDGGTGWYAIKAFGGYGDAAILADADDSSGTAGLVARARIGVRATGKGSAGVGVGAYGHYLGVSGASENTGVFGETDEGVGTYGRANTSGYGVSGYSVSGIGTAGLSDSSYGVKGRSVHGTGVFGTSDASSPSYPGVGVHGSLVYGSAVKATAFDPSSVAFEVDSGGSGTQLRLGQAPDMPYAQTTYHFPGDIVFDKYKYLWVCVTPGIPGEWRLLAAPIASGCFVPLGAPFRAYDSRPGMPPTGVGPKTPLAADTARTVSLAGALGFHASGAIVNIVATRQASGGYLALYRNGLPYPGTSNLNWTAANQTVAVTTFTAVDANRQCAVRASCTCDVVIDVLGYYLT